MTLISPEYWGGHFPLLSKFWGGHFPKKRGTLIVKSIPPDTQAIAAATTPAGAGTFSLLFEESATVTYTFGVVVNKGQSGKETRYDTDDLPSEKYAGKAMLADGDVRALRSLLQSSAAGGAIFQLALPYEELTLEADASANLVNTTDTEFADWAVAGQRFLIASPGEETITGVIQARGANQLALDVEPGDIGRRGGRIMPTVPVFLDTQQNFDRYPSATTEEEQDDEAHTVETFNISATNALVGYTVAGLSAILALSTITTSGSLDGITFVARVPGAAGNSITVQFEAATLPFHVDFEMTENLTTSAVLVRFRAGVATVQGLITLFGSSTLIMLDVGVYVDTATLQAALDEFVPIPLAGGTDSGPGEVGRGATVATFDGRPVYDRGILVNTTATDMLQALTNLIEMGSSMPLQQGNAAVPDWGRAVNFESDERIEQQFFKRFLSTVCGPRRAFWLPTWRPDLVPSSFEDGAAAVVATLPLAPPLTNSGVMDGLTISALVAGAGGNAITISMVGDALDLGGDLDEDVSGKTVVIRFVPGITTDDQIVALVNGSSGLVRITGTPGHAAIQGGDDEFPPTHLYDGADAIGTRLVLPNGGDPATASAGDLMAWWPNHDHIQIIQDDGTLTYAIIISTYTADAGLVKLNLNVGLSDSAIVMVSWVEKCRFESNSFVVTHAGAKATSNNVARAIQ